MSFIFKNFDDFHKREAEIWQRDDIKDELEAVNKRFEDILLRSVTVRDEVRRGVRKSDEEIEISIYQWIHRFLPKVSRYKYIDGVVVGDIKGQLVCDLFERHAKFEPVMKLEEFADSIVKNCGNLPDFVKKIKNKEYLDYKFGTNKPDLLALNVKRGLKKATSSLYEIYELENDNLPQNDDISIILYENGNVCCAIKNIDVKIIPFCEVAREHAMLEGEGDRGLSYWSIAHHVFFNKELKKYGKQFTNDMLVVLERFEKIFEPEDIYRMQGKWL